MPLRSAARRVARAEERFVSEYVAPHAVRVAFAAYAFVFCYYGFLKLIPRVSTPVREPVAAFVEALGLPAAAAALGLPFSVGAVMVLIGLYEVCLGLLFALRRIRAVFVPFLVHQAVTFLTLLVVPEAYFQRPFIYVRGTVVPWLFDSFAAYVLKNTIFVGGFLVLAAVTMGAASAAAHSEERE